MAEQLIIRVKVDGMGEGKGGGNLNSAAVGALGAQTLKTPLDKLKADSFKAKGNTFAYSDRTTRKIAQENSLDYKNLGLAKGSYGGFRNIELSEDGVSDTLTQETAWGAIGGAKFAEQNLAKVQKVGTAAAWKTVSSAASIYQHRSNNSYANAKLNNSIKLAGYGAAVAVAGPAAIPFIVGNELANAIVSVSNYNWDRRTEQKQINNIKTIAGNINYGRNRGAY